MNVPAVQAAFPEVAGVAPLTHVRSGQKEVFSGNLRGSPVVLKIIHDGQSDERVVREIEAVARLRSVYVPEVFEHGQRNVEGRPRTFIIEKRIDGHTLRTVLNSAPDRKLPLVAVLGMTDALLHAVADFEVANLVHRDIKPENLLIDTAGKVWVIDFGIVRMLDEVSVTGDGDRGPATLAYGALEQIRNRKREINSRADLFAVGLVAHEALFGSNHHLRGNPNHLQLIRRRQDEDLPRLGIPGDTDGFADLVAALTARYASRRPQNAAEARAWFAAAARPLGYTTITK